MITKKEIMGILKGYINSTIEKDKEHYVSYIPVLKSEDIANKIMSKLPKLELVAKLIYPDHATYRGDLAIIEKRLYKLFVRNNNKKFIIYIEVID